MQLRRFIAGGLVAVSAVLVPFSAAAMAEPKKGTDTTVYCYRPGDEVTKTNPYSVGATYTDWSTNPPRTYKCGADGKFTVMPIVRNPRPRIERVPALNLVHAAR